MPLPYPYPYDSLGTAGTNRIVNEVRVITPPTDPELANWIMPAAAPFHSDSVIMRLGPLPTDTALTFGVDYVFTHYFVSLSQHIAKSIYGSIKFLNRNFSGSVYLTYQTVGGPFTVADTLILENLSRSLYNISTVTWDQIQGVPQFFPPAPHQHDVADMTGMADVVTALNSLVTAIAGQNGNIAGIVTTLQQHIASLSAHTPAAVGLGNVPNFAVATLQDVLDAVSNKLMTPERTLQQVTLLTAGLATAAQVAAETIARQNADTALQQAIDNEATARQNADTLATQALATESTSRQNADALLQSQIDGINAVVSNAVPQFDVSICPSFGDYLTFQAHNGGWIWVDGKNRHFTGATYDVTALTAGVLHSVFLWWNGTNLVPLFAPIGDTTFLPRRNNAVGGIVMAYNKVTNSFDNTKTFIGHVYRNIGLNAWDPNTYRNMGTWYVRSYHHDCGTMVAGFYTPPTPEFYEARPYAREGRICNTAKLMGYSHVGETVSANYSEWGVGAQDGSLPSTTLNGDVVTGGTFATVGHTDLVLGYIVWPYEEIRVKGQFNAEITSGYAPVGVRAHAPFAMANGSYQDRVTVIDRALMGVADQGYVTGYNTTVVDTIHYTDSVYWESSGAAYPGPELGGFRVYDMVWSSGINVYGGTGNPGSPHESAATRLIVEPVSLNRNVSEVIAYPGNIAAGMGGSPYY